MSKRNPEKPDVPVFALITATQRKSLERLKIENQRSIGFLVREAIEQYLAAAKKAS